MQEAVILGRVKSTVGSTFNPSRLSEDIKAIFGLGFFDDVQMRVEDFEGRGEGGLRGDRASLRARRRLRRPQEGRPRHPAGEDRHQARERLQPRRGAARRRQAPRLLRGRGVLRGPDHPDRGEVQRRRRAPGLQHRRGASGHHRQDRVPRQQGADRLPAQGRDGDEGAPVLHPARQGAASAAGHRRRPPPRALQRLRLHPGPDRVDRHRHRSRARARDDHDHGGGGAPVQGRRRERHGRHPGAGARGLPADPVQAWRRLLLDQDPRQRPGDPESLQHDRPRLGRTSIPAAISAPPTT